jgi:uncharacterized protein
MRTFGNVFVPSGWRRRIQSEFKVQCVAGPRAFVVTARLYESAGPLGAWLVLAPGAGANHDHPFMVTFSRALSARGLSVVTFNFPYMEQGRRVPDPTEVLEACWHAALRAVRERAGAGARLFAGGKSMGGRIASQAAARGGSSSGLCGLVFLGYPLHPPGRPEQRRTAHWPDVRLPALFIQGARDAFATPDELRADLSRFGGKATVFIVDGGDHSFRVPRRGLRTQDAVYGDMQDAIVAWVGQATVPAPEVRPSASPAWP